MSKNQKVKTVQFAVGVDLLGSKLTLSTMRGTELEDTGNAVIAHSKSANRWVKIPYSNIKGMELFAPEEDKKESKGK